jgi:hypothetical protein
LKWWINASIDSPIRALGGGVTLGSWLRYVDALADDANRFADLVQSDGVTIEVVAEGADDDVELDLVVGEVRHRATQVPRDAGRTKERSGHPEGQRLLGRQGRDADHAIAKDRLSGQQFVVFERARVDRVADDEHVVLPAVGQVGRHAAGAHVVQIEAQARGLFEEGEDQLSFA